MQGKIIKGIAGFYYVHIAGKGVYECKAKGIFRKNKIKPLVGDDVVIDILDEEKREGNIRDILARKNALIRPAVANVDQAMVIFAISRPAPNLSLLDRFLISMERMYQSLSVLTKVILQSRKRRQDFRRFMKTVAVRFFLPV